MPKVGSYEILDETYLSRHGSLSRARLEGHDGVFAVKTFGGPIDDPSEPHWELQTFLDRARLQQVLVAGGARRWAPIHELGIDVDWAYYATDYYPLTARRIIDERFKVKNAALHAIVLGVTQGLSEIKALRNRPHGNLKPGNVLVDGTELPGAAVLLSDPATNGQAAKCGDAGDLKALGELIHELVMHRPSQGQWPVPPAAQWGALGARGEKWRKLCSDLLNPEPAERPRLPAIAQLLHGLRSRRKPRFRKFFAVAAVLALLAGAGVAIISALDHSARTQFVQLKSEWFGKFMDAVPPAPEVIEAQLKQLDATTKPATQPAGNSLATTRANLQASLKRAKAWQNDPDLKRIVAEANIPAMRGIDTNLGHLIRWKLYEYNDVHAAVETIQKIQNEIPGRWQRADRASELRRKFQSRGWTQPADYLAKLVDATQPGPGVDVAAGIDRLLAASPNVESGLKLADKDWNTFTDRIKAIQTPHDAVVNELGNVLLKSAASDVHLSDAGFTGFDELKRDAGLAEQVTKTLADTFPTNVDKQPFDKDVARAIDVKHVKKQDIDTWLAIVKFHAYRHEEAVAAGLDLRKRLSDAVDLVGHSRMNPDESTQFETARHEATVAVSQFEQTPFTRRTLDDGSFDRQRDQIRNRIEGLKRFYHPEGPEQWLDALPAIATASDRINTFWDSWKKVLREAMPQMLADTNVFKGRQQASEQLRSLLVNLDQNFPPTPPLPNDAFVAAAKRRREMGIDELLPHIDLRSPKLDPEIVKVAVTSFSAWTANLVALSRDFPINKEVLGPNDFVDEKWKKRPEFWNEPAIQALVKDDVARLNRLRAMDTASRADLVKAVNGGGDAEVALAAWRLLGAESMRPLWPTQIDELKTEVRFRKRLSDALKGLKDPTEADLPNRELTEQAPIRWRRFVENATAEPMLRTAMALREGYGIDDKEVAKLAAPFRYNLKLSQLHAAIDGGEDQTVRDALTDVSAIAAELKDRPEVAKLPEQIARISMKEPFADAATGDIYNFTLPGVNKPIDFKRVEPSGGARPFYLCTTDISFGQFTAVLEAMHAWPQARQLPWPCEIGKADPRRGPRTWEWGGPPSSPLTTPLLWLAPEEYNDFPPPFRAGKFNRMSLSDQVGGNPSPDHPIQYVSAQVALLYAGVCGCRLPTPAEWQAAYAGFEKSVTLENWNLRDQTWEVQRRYVAAGGGSRWPDEGIFPATASIAAVGRSATSRPGNDGALYFQPIGAARGNVFRHLVGNVAQFLCDVPDADQQVANRTTAVGIRQFLERYPKSLYVIGGSALSAPEVPIDKPLPVTRTEEAYADVGFRLAFTAPSRNLAEKVKWAIGDPPYFWPKPVAAADRR